MKDNLEPKEGLTLIVLGGGFKYGVQQYPFTENQRDLGLAKPSKIRVAAAVQRIVEGIDGRNPKVTQVIFTGGHTAGKKWPSEAEASQSYALRLTRPLGNDFNSLNARKRAEVNSLIRNSLREENSTDTSENAQYTAELVDPNTQVEIISNLGHPVRAKRIFKAFGVKAEAVHAETLLWGRSRRYRNLRGFTKIPSLKAMALEAAANAVLFFDPKGLWMRSRTQKRGR